MTIFKIICFKNGFRYFTIVLVTGLIFAVVMGGMTKTARLFCTTSGHCQVQGRGIWEAEELPFGEKGLFHLGWVPKHLANELPSHALLFII